MHIAKLRRGFAGRLRADVRGESFVEFALVAMLLFLLMFVIIDFGRLFYVKATLESAMREAGRFAVTGRHLNNPNNPGQMLSRVDSIITTAKKYAMGINISNIRISSPQGGPTRPAGGPRETVIIKLDTSLRLITPFAAQYFGPNGYTFTVGTTFLNEPFPPSQIN
jgi:hypothetical protein